jgi:hypothetical protein
MHDQRELTRRQVMAYAAAGASGLMLPADGEAGVWSCINELHPKRKIRMELTGEAERQRFQTVLRYLQDERIKIEIADMGYAKPANEFSDLEPDDLLTLERWHLERDQEIHVRNLIAATGVSAFDRLVV